MGSAQCGACETQLRDLRSRDQLRSIHQRRPLIQQFRGHAKPNTQWPIEKIPSPLSFARAAQHMGGRVKAQAINHLL